MQKKLLILLLMLMISHTRGLVAGEVVLIEGRDGDSIITNDAKIVSGAKKQQRLGKAEVMIFPTRGKSRPRPRAERILTGIFSGSETSDSSQVLPEETYALSTRRERPVTVKTADTIAWITEGGTIYHDPFLECSTGTHRVWINDIRDLCGLEPCEECFVKTAHAPEFIKKESGGLDLASATQLLNNKEFLSWANDRLPVKNPGFISTRRLLVYPKMEMTEAGLRQLAKEVELAYRRHTWRIIEVVVKKSEIDTGSISSFGDERDNADHE